MIRQQPCIDQSSDPSELYTKVLFQSTRDQVTNTKQPRQRLVNALSLSLRSLSPSGVKSRLQANLLYLFFSPIPLSPLSPFLCVFAGKPRSRALIERRTERLYKARASVLSRGSLGYRGTSGPARSVKITHNLRRTNG